MTASGSGRYELLDQLAEEFAARYGGAEYARLKAKYDPAGAFPPLYEKCVLRG